LIGLQFLANMSWQAAFLAGVVPFIIPEIGKLIPTTVISKPLFISLKNTAYFA
jgi:biotin transport system substrate-specific component